MQNFSYEDLRIMIERCQTEARYLTDWEKGFIESVAEQLTRKGSLSPDQMKVLDRIYTEKTP